MSFLFGHNPTPPAPPPAPPPPPLPPSAAQSTIVQQGATQRASLLSAAGDNGSQTDVTGGQGTSAPSTTKSLLGG